MKNQRRAKKEKEPGDLKAEVVVEFELNPYYEQLLEMRERKPDAYRVMSAPTHLAVEAYVKAKDASFRQAARKAA